MGGNKVDWRYIDPGKPQQNAFIESFNVPAPMADKGSLGRDPLPGSGLLANHERVDWHTRKGLAWRISNTLEAGFCVDALNEAIHKFGPPEIMNTDQGSRFTSFAWTDRLRRSNVRISMPPSDCMQPPAGNRRKGHFLDNIFVERLWRSLKYECAYLNDWETGSEARAGVRKWIEFYNHKRPHSSLGGRPPAVVYWQRIETTNPDQRVQRVA